MDTLHDRLAQLAQDAPTGGAPAAELWARGRRTHRIRAAALAATLLVVAAAGTGIGVRLADVDGNRSFPAPAGTGAIALPIEYPAGKKLPNLGDTPGPLAAVWLSPRAGGGAPEVVGLVAATGRFGTLPIQLSDTRYEEPGAQIALSPDGRRIAYDTPLEELVVRDLVSGQSTSPTFDFQIRVGYAWVDSTHLVGHVAGGSDIDGWVWEPGTAPELVNPHPYLEGYGGRDLWVFIGGGLGPRSCSLPALADATGRINVPVLCDVLGFVGSEFVLGHWNSDRLHGDWNGPDDGNRTVVALDVQGITTYPFGSPEPREPPQFDDPALRHVVVAAGAPDRVTFATDLIGDALDSVGSTP